MVQKIVFIFYFWHPTHARTTRYEEAFLPERKKRPWSLRSLGLASLLWENILIRTCYGHQKKLFPSIFLSDFGPDYYVL